MVIVGSDRIAANGDVANKIGTYTSALAAKAAGIPFYVAAPTTTIDPDCPSGDAIPIEERSDDEIRYTWGWSDEGVFTRVRTVPDTSPGRNPAFDVTPAALVAGIITEKGIIEASPEGITSVARHL
jgi:methylthioribose-1-phosphate isomerase